MEGSPATYTHQVLSLSNFQLFLLHWIEKRLTETLSAVPRFCVEGVPKSLDFGYFALVWCQTEKQEAGLQGPVYLDRTANCLIKLSVSIIFST